jgi:endonuclease/exonuclease/phosphatase family metal-dependent hydrolase
MLDRMLKALLPTVLLGLAACSAAQGDDFEDDPSADESAVKGQKGVHFEVLQHNIGAGTENDPGAKSLASTFAEIDSRKPDVVMLEEVCASQVPLIKAKYPKWNVYFSQMSAAHPGCLGPKGQVLATDHAMSDVTIQDLGDVDPVMSKHFTLLCGAVAMGGKKVYSCVTHLRAGGSTPETDSLATQARARQVLKIKTLLRDRLQTTQAVVVAGDLNARPEEALLDPLYRVTRSGAGNGGLFDEADQSDANREGYAEPGVRCATNACRSGEKSAKTGKLDYVLFSHARVVGGLAAEVLGTGGSAHALYYASADLAL